MDGSPHDRFVFQLLRFLPLPEFFFAEKDEHRDAAVLRLVPLKFPELHAADGAGFGEQLRELAADGGLADAEEIRDLRRRGAEPGKGFHFGRVDFDSGARHVE